MKNSLISIYLTLIIIVTMLPFQVVGSEIYIKKMEAKVSRYSPEVRVEFTVSQPYFQGSDSNSSYYRSVLTFETPRKMEKRFIKDDKFTIHLSFEEKEIEYLSQSKSVYLTYPANLTHLNYTDYGVEEYNLLYSKINVPDLLRVIKAAKDSDVADRKKREEDNKPVNQLKDFFGIGR